MKIFRRQHGAVSVFLVIILVPMITVSSLFVDASKVKLGRGVAESAADLTINTALTDYDTKLKDLYGLFATAQDTEELYSKLEDYYRTCITSSGVGAEDADNFVEMITAQLGLVEKSGDVDDILNIELLDFDVSKRTDASLANAAVMKKQIVDFMKYRSPINTGLSFISSLQSFATLSKQTDLVQKRTDYYEAEKSVMEILQDAWDEINEYNKLTLITDEEYFTKMKNNFSSSNNWEQQYKADINLKTIKDLYETQNYVDFTCKITKVPNVDVKDAEGNIHKEDIWRFTYPSGSGFYGPDKDFTDYYAKSEGGYDKNTLPSASDISSSMNSFYSHIQSMEAYKASINLNSPVDVYDLQYLVQEMRAGNLSGYANEAWKVYSEYQKLKNAMIWLEGFGNTTTVITVTINGSSVSKSIDSHFSDISTKYESTMDSAGKITNMFTGFSESVQSNNQTNTSGVNSKVNSIATIVGGYVETLESAAGHLEEASKKISTAKESVESGDLASKKQAWSSAANDSDLSSSSIAKQDRAEINELGTYLNTTDMQKMITRLNNVAAKLRTTADEIKKYKFDDKFIGDIDSYDVLKSTIANKVGDNQLKKVELSEAALNAQANGWFSWASGNVNLNWINDSGYQYKLHGTGTDKLNFYSYLYQHFNKGEVSAKTEKKEEDSEGAKGTYDNIKDKAKSSADSKAKETEDNSEAASGNEINKLKGLPSENAGSDAKTAAAESVKTGDGAAGDASKTLGSMFSGLGEAVKGFGTTLRDNLYVADYAMSMFSYDTVAKEAGVKNEGKTTTPQTLTLTPINTDNNYAYLREVEYIIYGGSNNSNITKAYASIYAIRLGFNCIYAFTNSEIRETAFAIATPISAATFGVIPVPLIQAAIIFGIACVESSIDIVDLKEGKSVPLFKSEETWHCSVSGLVNEAKGLAGDFLKDASEKVIDTGVAELNKVLDMTDEELDKYIADGTDKLQSSLEEAYDSLITRHANTAIQKLTTLANQAIEEYLSDPATDMEKYVSDGLDSWLADERAKGADSSSDLSYVAKEEAVRIIKDQFIGTVISELKKVHDGVQDKMEELTKQINNQLEDVRSKIVQKVVQGSGVIQEQKDKFKKKITESLNNGATNIKDTLNESIDDIFGSSSVQGSDNTGIASLLSFSYSDYMRLFLMIGLYTNEEGVLLRIGDAIQANMAKQTSNTEYRLAKSAMYVEISATVQVHPTLLAVPLIASVENNPVSNTKWYTFEISEVAGY